jgi:hypothetical protein
MAQNAAAAESAANDKPTVIARPVNPSALAP